MGARATKEDQRSDESRIPHLPDDVLMEILSRLPIKTLMAVKCVCKSWLKLVSGDTHFAALHDRRSQTEILLRSSIGLRVSPKLYMGTLQIQNNTVSGIKLSLLFNPLDLDSNVSVDWNREGNLTFVNSCNGFLCFLNFSNSPANLLYTVICNPVTGEFITVLPRATPLRSSSYHGLGFSRKENRYKLLRMTTKEPLLSAEICTLEGGSSWRSLGDFPYRVDTTTSSFPYFTLFWFPYVFLEGKLHFDSPYNNVEDHIGCFDFDNEQFGKVPLPPTEYPHLSKYIGQLGGCLSLTRFGTGRRIEIWVMKEYGVKDSWTKAFSIEKHCFSGLPRPLVCSGNGETLVFQVTENLVLYNSVLNTIRPLGSGHDSLQVITYTPTLLQLKDVLAGYEACVQHANSRSTDAGFPDWWRPFRDVNSIIDRDPKCYFLLF